jgi:hypothetical protein
MQSVGSRAQVMHGNAKKTSGGLQKKDLMYNKQGNIVSRAKAKLARTQKHLAKAGWTAKKGKFGAIRMKGFTAKKSRKNVKKGGANVGGLLNGLLGNGKAEAVEPKPEPKPEGNGNTEKANMNMNAEVKPEGNGNTEKANMNMNGGARKGRKTPKARKGRKTARRSRR